MSHPTRIRVEVVQSIPSDAQRTQTHKYTVYHSVNNQPMQFLAALPVNDEFYHIVDRPTLGALHRFAVTATNMKGESELGDIAEYFTDAPPPSPAILRMKKYKKDSLAVYFDLPTIPAGCSPVEDANVVYYEESKPDERFVIKNVGISSGYQIIYGLNVEAKYIFQIEMRNKAGWGTPSPPTEPVCLDSLISTPPPPAVDSQSPSSIKVTLNLPPAQSLAREQITGFRIFGYRGDEDIAVEFGRVSLSSSRKSTRNLHMSRSSTKSPSTSPQSSSSSLNTPSLSNVARNAVVIEGLGYGENYYIYATYTTAGGEDSDPSPRVWVPLAASIPLPPSPDEERQNRVEPRSRYRDILSPNRAPRTRSILDLTGEFKGNSLRPKGGLSKSKQRLNPMRSHESIDGEEDTSLLVPRGRSGETKDDKRMRKMSTDPKAIAANRAMIANRMAKQK